MTAQLQAAKEAVIAAGAKPEDVARIADLYVRWESGRFDGILPDLPVLKATRADFWTAFRASGYRVASEHLRGRDLVVYYTDAVGGSHHVRVTR